MHPTPCPSNQPTQLEFAHRCCQWSIGPVRRVDCNAKSDMCCAIRIVLFGRCMPGWKEDVLDRVKEMETRFSVKKGSLQSGSVHGKLMRDRGLVGCDGSRGKLCVSGPLTDKRVAANLSFFFCVFFGKDTREALAVAYRWTS